MKRLIRSYVGLLVAAFVLAGFAAQPAMAQEKAKDAKAATAEKGKRVVKTLAENDKVRAQEVTYKPGDENTTVPSSSTRVVRALKGGTLQRTYPDGKTEKTEWKTGQVRISAPSGQYTTKNIGKSDIVLFVVQLKEPKK